jgi:Zn-dependent protease with chaperone function
VEDPVTKPSSPSLAWRAVGAVALMVGFYGLAIAIVAALLFVPYAQLRYAQRMNIRLTIFCIVGAFIIIWSIVPRRDRFVAPGARLTPDRHPRFFKELKAIAEASKQEMPAEVYLIPEVNAWVSQRGGVMGSGGRRVMGVGLALLHTITVSQLRGVLAHEFGHYFGGDTKLGPWVYKTRAAIARTVMSLRRHSSFIQAPFVWYGRLFLRITHAVSRQQEYAADRLAAGIAGSEPLATGLETIHKEGLTFGLFWANEYLPVVTAGFQAPLLDGFERFRKLPEITRTVSNALKKALEQPRTDPYDTHPRLPDRLAALEQAPRRSTATETSPAISLLEDVPGLECLMLEALTARGGGHSLSPLGWDEVGTRVYLQPWQDLARQNARMLDGITAGGLPEAAEDPEALAKWFGRFVGKEITSEQALRIAFTTVGAALATALADRGWVLNQRPGVGFRMSGNGKDLQPFSVFPRLVAGELKAGDWQEQCKSMGIFDLDLGHLGRGETTA